MKAPLVIALLSSVTGLATAQEVGRVLSSTPVVQQVAVPRQVCNTQQVLTQTPKTGAGAVMGAIAGGAMGNAIGGGTGRALATAIGVFGGAAVGNQIEGGPAQVQNVQQCTTQVVYENQTVGYDVVYEYAGQQHTARMAQDPGPTVELQVSPVADQGPPAPQNYEVSSGTTYVPAEPYPAPAYAPPAVVYPSYNPVPIGMSLNFGYVRHGR